MPRLPVRPAIRPRPHTRLALFGALALLLGPRLPADPPALASASPAPASVPAATWRNGPPTNSAWFPIGVWLQNPSQAPRHKAAGINLYVGLWKGPTPAQLDALDRAGMPVICDQNEFALRHLDRPTIIGWMHGDEPDNAQALPGGSGYGPPILPEVIVRDYQRLRAADPSRPILLNLGQGVAWDDYIGRGTRRNRPEDYPAYVQGCDIASFDIYPAVHTAPAVAGKLEFVARGVERLRAWAGPHRQVWNCIECTRISNPKTKPTPAQVRSEVWMSLIRGSRGLIYFVHQFEPVFREAALLDDPEMLAAVTAINRQIHALAPFLNAPDAGGSDRPSIHPATPDAPPPPVAVLAKRLGQDLDVYAVNLSPTPTRATLRWASLPASTGIRDLDSHHTEPLTGAGITTDFPAYGVRLLRLGPTPPPATR